MWERMRNVVRNVVLRVMVDILHKQVGDPFMSVPSASVSIQTDQNI